MGPGAYDPDKADGLTKSKSPNINMGSSPSRPQSFAKGGDVNVAPGQYDDGVRFNSNVKSFKIGEKRTEKIRDGMGPGAYDPDRADSLTKTKTPNINMGTSPSRPHSFAKGGDVNVAPGQYDFGKKFGEDTKSFRIGEKREGRVAEGVGPGAYDPDRADGQTKAKHATVDFSASPGRPGARAPDVDVAPGQYDDRDYKFGKDVKPSFTIGERRDKPIQLSVGPGEYDLDRANNLTKPKVPQVDMGSSPSRPARLGQTVIPSRPALEPRNSFSNAKPRKDRPRVR